MNYYNPRIPSHYPDTPRPTNPADSPRDPEPGKNDPSDPGKNNTTDPRRRPGENDNPHECISDRKEKYV